MYRPLPDGLTIKNSPIEGLGLFSNIDIKKNSFIGVTHIRDEQFENKYIRTPLGGFYNHSNDPTVIRMVSDFLPRLNFGDIIVSLALALSNKSNFLSATSPPPINRTDCLLSSMKKGKYFIKIFLSQLFYTSIVISQDLEELVCLPRKS